MVAWYVLQFAFVVGNIGEKNSVQVANLQTLITFGRWMGGWIVLPIWCVNPYLATRSSASAFFGREFAGMRTRTHAHFDTHNYIDRNIQTDTLNCTLC